MTNLKTIREQKGINQTQLAAMLGVSQGSVSAWETGRWEPSIDALKKIALILSVTVDDLIGDTNDARGI